MYFMSDPQALHVTRNVIPGKLGVDLHLHRMHIPLVLVEMTLHLHSYLQGIDPGVTRGQISPNMERMGHRYRCPLPKVLACYENLCEWYHGYVITADTAGNTENGVYTVTRGMTQISELSLRTSIFFGSRAWTLKLCNESNPCHKWNVTNSIFILFHFISFHLFIYLL